MGNYLSYTSLATLAAGDVLGIIDVSDTTHAAGGTTKHVTAANLAAYVLTSPTVDDGTNEIMDFVGVGSAVNFLRATSAATGSGPTLSAVGDNTDIDLSLIPKGSGSVGIGTASPGAGTALHIEDSDALLALTAPGQNHVTQGAFVRFLSNVLYVANRSGEIRFEANNIHRMTLVGSTGNLGIGIAAPPAKLSVADGTTATDLRVYNTWTDATNGEWLELDWKTTLNTLRIATNANGSGSQRDIVLDGANRATKISDPSGGSTIDTEARTAINAIIDALEAHGLSATA